MNGGTRNSPNTDISRDDSQQVILNKRCESAFEDWTDTLVDRIHLEQHRSIVNAQFRQHVGSGNPTDVASAKHERRAGLFKIPIGSCQ